MFKVHLIISILIVVPVAFVYGLNPSLCFNIELNTTDAKNVFKALMGVYLGLAMLWLLGVCYQRYLKIALVSNSVFMIGLGLGRLISIMTDGTPSIVFTLGTIGELILGGYGIWVCNYRKHLLNNHSTET